MISQQDEKFRRNVAYKMRIGDLSAGKPVFDGEKFVALEMNGKNVVRVNLIGSIVDKYNSEGDKRFLFLTLDDGSGQIKLKTFGDDINKFSDVSQGQTVIAIGVLRFFNNEVYVSPEIIREQNPKYLLVRKMELEKNSLVQKPISNSEIRGIREKLIDLIKDSEKDGGIAVDSIGAKINSSEDSVNRELQKLLEEGVIFEPRPGKIRWLG